MRRQPSEFRTPRECPGANLCARRAEHRTAGPQRNHTGRVQCLASGRNHRESELRIEYFIYHLKYFGNNYAFFAAFTAFVLRVDFVVLLLSLVVFRARFGLTGSVIWSMTSEIALVAFRATLPA